MYREPIVEVTQIKFIYFVHRTNDEGSINCSLPSPSKPAGFDGDGREQLMEAMVGNTSGNGEGKPIRSARSRHKIYQVLVVVFVCRGTLAHDHNDGNDNLQHEHGRY